jgi:hypothetical protein
VIHRDMPATVSAVDQELLMEEDYFACFSRIPKLKPNSGIASMKPSFKAGRSANPREAWQSIDVDLTGN